MEANKIPHPAAIFSFGNFIYVSAFSFTFTPGLNYAKAVFIYDGPYFINAYVKVEHDYAKINYVFASFSYIFTNCQRVFCIVSWWGNPKQFQPPEIFWKALFKIRKCHPSDTV